MTEVENFSEQIEDNQNKNAVRCQFCNSLMLKPRMAKFTENEVELPLIHQKNMRKIDEVETEPLKDFWIVDNVFIFENIAFTYVVESLKFIACADCDKGPVGYQDMKTEKIYVSLNRVKHVPKN